MSGTNPNGAVALDDGSADFVAQRQRIWGTGGNYTFGPATVGLLWTHSQIDNMSSVFAGGAGFESLGGGLRLSTAGDEGLRLGFAVILMALGSLCYEAVLPLGAMLVIAIPLIATGRIPWPKVLFAWAALAVTGSAALFSDAAESAAIRYAIAHGGGSHFRY